MKVLIVYDSQSMNRNTEKVAKAISNVLKERGFSVDCIFVKEANAANIRNYDCVLAGGPTHAFRPTKPIMKFLDEVAKDKVSGKLAAAFDTQIQSRFSGNAAKGIHKRLENLGFKTIMPPLVTYVEGKIAEIHLKDGEIEKTRNWAIKIADTFSKSKTNDNKP
ncbi:flavodoxin family protein [Candidatus Bathyarchaeota archaeon]|nr:flavodoxin family protein [Candidatus Bathyarchaeota archaeon]